MEANNDPGATISRSRCRPIEPASSSNARAGQAKGVQSLGFRMHGLGDLEFRA